MENNSTYVNSGDQGVNTGSIGPKAPVKEKSPISEKKVSDKSNYLIMNAAFENVQSDSVTNKTVNSKFTPEQGNGIISSKQNMNSAMSNGAVLAGSSPIPNVLATDIRSDKSGIDMRSQRITSEPVTKAAMALKELGLLDDVELPWEHRNGREEGENAKGLSRKSSSRHAGKSKYDNEQPRMAGNSLMAFTDKGYTSDTTDFSRHHSDIHENNLTSYEDDIYRMPNNLVSHLQGFVEEEPVALSDHQHDFIEYPQNGEKKQSKKNKIKHGKTSAGRNRIAWDDDTQPTFYITDRPKSRQKRQDESHQTSNARTHIQDSSNANNHGGAKPSSANIFSKIAGRKHLSSGSLQEELFHEKRSRPQSAAANYITDVGSSRYPKITKETNRLNLNKSNTKIYGSMATADSNAERKFQSDNRGYHSESDGRSRRRDNDTEAIFNPLYEIYQPLPGADGMYEDTMIQNLQQESAVQASKGVFRTLRSITPKNLLTKMSKRKEALADSRRDIMGEPSGIQKPVAESGSKASDEIDRQDKDNDDKKVELSQVTSSTEKLGGKPETRTKVYFVRWYLLLLFSLANLLWNAIWSTWGPIAQSAEAVYNWSNGDVAMFTWLGNIPFFFVMFPVAYLMDVKGMRIAMILSCSLMFVGAGMRCIPLEKSDTIWLIYIGQFVNGMAGSVTCSASALLSGLWFPPSQRASATAISTIAGYLGACFSFVIGPFLVSEPNSLSPINNSVDSYGSFWDDDSNSTSNATDYDSQEQGIKQILYIHAGTAGALLLLVLIYFPSKPQLPPSISASIPREKYIKGIKMLAKNKQFWVTAFAYAIPVGVYEAWQVVLDVNLHPRVTQQTAGWLDFYATLGGCVSGLLVSRFADFFTRQMKLFLLVFYSFSAVSILWFTLVVLDILPFDTVSIYAAIIAGGVFLDGGAPLFFELVIEVSYPVGEGVTSGILQLICAAAGIVFLVLVQIESLGKVWMNWCYFGVVTLAVPLLFFINTSYSRADIDDMEVDIDSEDEEATGIGAPDDLNEKTPLLKGTDC